MEKFKKEIKNIAYSFNRVTIRADNSESGMAKIDELWADIMQGKIPLDFIEKGVLVKDLSPISAYRDYESDENGKYNLRQALHPTIDTIF